MHLGDRLRALREQKGLSLRELASRTSLSASRLQQLERDPAANPSLRTLLALQNAYGLDSIEALLGPLPSSVLAREVES